MRTLEAGKRIGLSNLLFATDFSRFSNAALPFALAIAQQYGAKLFGVHVMAAEACVLASPESWTAFYQQEQEIQQAEIAKLEQQLHEVPHEVLTAIGGVWDEISRLVREQQIDLLILGTHGRTGVRKLVLGSIAEQVFRRACCPVLTVGPHVSVAQASIAEFKHVLLASDFGAESHAAAAYAVSLAEEHRARLSVMHVLHERREDEDYGPSAETALQQLRSLVPAETELWHPPDYFVQFGVPATQILQFADAQDADLIVMGVHAPQGRVGAVTHFAHTTAQDIVAHARCPVLTVRG